ncbi:universal stress protein [Kitasatospora sp. DSM 101779]|uniref:universal stress protein n=1 Tax=Kitasatospora sp. DSM 101779 TaxID=2853165 RepID=UPI0021DB35F0|nr:universal stress protein [Kitasatospora sp. DSM 101779]MCU7826482.1 universal stress protein [Kitasatospora sp. DSM 101779]
MALPVLAVVDGSPVTPAVADWAAAEAGRRGAPLCLVHPLPRPLGAAPGLPGVSEVRGRALGLLAETAARLRLDHRGLEVRTALVEDPGSGGLLAAAHGAGLVVLATHGPRHVSPRFLDALGPAVAGRADCPTVLLHDTAPAAPTGRVVAGVDPDLPAPQVVDFALDAAVLRGAELRIVAVEREQTEHTRRVLRRLAESLAERGPVASHASVEDHPGSAVEELVRVAGEGCDLLVVGCSGRRLGPVARAVVGRVRVPVAVVPHG